MLTYRCDLIMIKFGEVMLKMSNCVCSSVKQLLNPFVDTIDL